MSNNTNLQAPVLNLNGSSREALFGQLEAAYLAGAAFADRLAECAPHGRDYQTAPVGAYIKAREEHEARMRGVRDLLDQIESLVSSLQTCG